MAYRSQTSSFSAFPVFLAQPDESFEDWNVHSILLKENKRDLNIYKNS